MPMSIRFDEQRGPSTMLPLEVKRPSRSHRWYKWVPLDAEWKDLGSDALAFVGGYTLHTDPEVVPHTAAVYLEEILPSCDGWHVMVAYRWVEDREVYVGLVRSRAAFTRGSRQAPPWAFIRRPALDRVIEGAGPV